ncbi:hypothetical protein DNI29_04495 [Hymenobacter sediminis]|uniref:hypothetical protein n=1 Tax=Hymenobacter sediminis TaxID=2218621 RepID=UPI000DA66C7D|nr:hypothetical protein [Hymenobacter sediminis]RPD50062.1 hypothetical protein DNI29_04495 [Hymenobacter sediminis]
MAIKRLIRTLTYSTANLVRRVYYQGPLDANSLSVESTAARPNEVYDGEDYGEAPQDGYADGDLLEPEFCEDTVGISLLAQDAYPYARVVADPNSATCNVPAGTVCDLDFRVSLVGTNATLVFAPGRNEFTTNGTWFSSYDGSPFEEGKTYYPGLPQGEHLFRMRDAKACTAQQTVVVGSTGGSGGNPPAGIVIDSFEPTADVQVAVYYHAATRTLKEYVLPAGTNLLNPLPTNQRQRAEDEPISQRCEGMTQVRFYATLEPPYARLEIVPNSVECGYTPPSGGEEDPGPEPVLGCTDPAADNYNPLATQDNGTCVYTPVAKQPHFEVPLPVALRFTYPGRRGFDNTPLRQASPLNLNNPGFCQLLETGDTLIVQVQSNYAAAPTLRLLPCAGGAAAKTLTMVRVVQGAGQSGEFSAFIRPDTAGKARVYFNSEALPLPFAVGNRITISSAPGLNGTYPIQAVLQDATAAVPYLVLVAAYPTGAQRVDCTVTTTYSIQAFDTYQVALPLSGVARGCYTVELSATDPELPGALAVSEPVEVASAHADTLLLSYRNFDNAFGVNYTAGIVHRLRLRARFFERRVESEKEVLRQSDDSLVLLSAKARRKVTLTTFLLPDWLHEKIAVALDHDYVTIDGLEIVAEEAYTTTPVERYTLSNGSVAVEQRYFLGSGNGDDLEDVDSGSGDFLLVEGNRLLINR